MKRPSERRALALLTPYSGSNLGDGAIQDAMIRCLRDLRPDAEVMLITADVRYTEQLHGVPSFPLTGLHIPGYSMTLVRSQVDSGSVEGGTQSTAVRLSNSLVQFPAVHRWARRAYRLGKALARVIPTTVREARHVAKAFFLLRRAEALIVSGGGQLDEYWGGPMGHPYTLFKWALLARIARTKLIILSVGVGQLNSPLSRRFVGWALRWAAYRSYRDRTSKALLEDVAPVHQDPVYPDLAFSYVVRCPDEQRLADPADSKMTVGISPIAYLSPSGWPVQDARHFESYLSAVEGFASQLLAAGYRVMLFATDSPDRSTVAELFGRILARNTAWASRVSQSEPACVSELLTTLDEVDLVVASRLHGIILSHLSGKPTLAVSYDRKVLTYMTDILQAEHCVDIRGANADSLVHAFDRLREHGVVLRKMIGDHCDEYRSALHEQCGIVFGASGATVIKPMTARMESGADAARP